MHRAEKASSKLCREREVEKAQELHRRKIEGVKSYLTAITRAPAPPTLSSRASRKSTFLGRSLRQRSIGTEHTHVSQSSQVGTSKSVTVCSPSGGLQAEYGDDSYSDDDDGKDGISSSQSEEAPNEVSPSSFGKLDELRSVLVPVMAYTGETRGVGDLNYERYLDEITNPREESTPKVQTRLHQTAHSIRASAFRMRRLKQIEVDNVTLFGRIKNTPAHYRTEHFKRDWDQNVAYLTSICEFPIAEESIHFPPPRRHTHIRKRSPFARPLEQLPSLQFDSPPTIHPIKALPTSPRRAKPLNLSPAFRSLRKGLPQAPALPPLTASPRTTLTTKHKSLTAIAGSRVSFQSNAESQEALPTATLQSEGMSSIPRLSPERISPNSVVADPSRYTLLKIGRFIGGKYLVLTVFCGHGITNPYGFDVVALDPETQVEFRLSITKEMTHLLLETISSLSMAERTAAAAGTNLSMELIASCICDHIRYARMGCSEMVFLVATTERQGSLGVDILTCEDDNFQTSTQASTSDNMRLLLDAQYPAMAFCLHQHAHIVLDGDKVRRLHIFASTRPQQSCEARMVSIAQSTLFGPPLASTNVPEFNGLVNYQLLDGMDVEIECDQLQLSVNDLIHQLEVNHIEVESEPRERLSLDRMIVLSLQYLHIATLEDGRQGITLSTSRPNNWSCDSKSPCRPVSTSLHQNPDTRPWACRYRRAEPEDNAKSILQTGMLWRGTYLFACATLLCPGIIDKESGKTLRDTRDELLVLNVYNASTGRSSERTLDGDQVDEFSQKLGQWQCSIGSTPALVAFVKILLLRMRLDIDLRGHEIISFPSLDSRYHNAGLGGRSSPLAASRRSSPTKKTTQAVLDSLSNKKSADNELQRLTVAAIVIQAASRVFLRRLQERRHAQEQASEHGRSSIVMTLPSVVLAFIRRRAVKRIQLACRDYASRLARRKRAQHDLSGLSIKTPRSLTPTTRTKSRLGLETVRHPQETMPLSDNTAFQVHAVGGIDGTPCEDGDEDSMEDEEDEWPRHVDRLGSLEEGDCEDEPEHQIRVSLADSQSTDNAIWIKHESKVDANEPRTTRRFGRKVGVHYVFQKLHAAETSVENVVESRIIGLQGELVDKALLL